MEKVFTEIEKKILSNWFSGTISERETILKLLGEFEDRNKCLIAFLKEAVDNYIANEFTNYIKSIDIDLYNSFIYDATTGGYYLGDRQPDFDEDYKKVRVTSDKSIKRIAKLYNSLVTEKIDSLFIQFKEKRI